MRTPASSGLRRPALTRGRPGLAQARGLPLPPPTGGWDASSPLAHMSADRAVVLDNWIPRQGYVEIRRGHSQHATGLGTGVVDSLMVYDGVTPAASRLFAGANGKVYDATAASAAAEAFGSMTSNRWQWVNFTTPGGKFLWMCNGANAPKHYNGSSWATPVLSLTTFSDSDIVNVHAHKNRLWFVFKDSTVAGYLPTGAIAGTVTNFELGGLFTKGGYLVAMATMTRDGGAGSDDFAVFISSQGQVAVYAGTDPSDSQLWNLVGVYDLGPPIGYRCFSKVGADVALINIDGVLPLSKALGIDRNAARLIAMTANINNAMNDAARGYKGNFGWQLMPYPRGTYALLNVPITEGALQHQYVMNTLNGAWCRFTGQNANCWAVFKDELYFGGNNGAVFKADDGGWDNEAAIDAVGQCAYGYLGSPGLNKQAKLIQPLLTTDAQLRPSIGLSTDFKDNAVLGTPVAATEAAALFDEAEFDIDVFPVESRNISDWQSVDAFGNALAVHFRTQAHSERETTVRLNGFNLMYEPAAMQ